MTPQERDMLTAFLQQLAQAQAGVKDGDAERLIHETVARQPDAAYLLVQRAMGLDLALQAAQTRISALEADVERLKVPAPQPSGGFLSSLTGWGRSGGQAVVPSQGTPAGNAPAQAAPAPYPGAPGRPMAAAPSAWGSGMLGSVAATAAGVVAGSFIYQGIQNMMGHHQTQAASAPEPSRLADTSPAGSSAWAGDDRAGNDDMSELAAFDDDGDDYANDDV